MPEGRITVISESGKFIWFGTDQGVARMSKKSGKTQWITTKNSLLPSDHITSIASAPDGRVWIGTCMGILFWDNYAYLLINSTNTNLPDDHVTALAYDNFGQLWVGTHGGFLVKTKGFQFIFCMIEQPLWIDETISSLHATSTSLYQGKLITSRSVMARPLVEGEIISSINADANGDLWVGLFLSGLVKINRNTWVFYPAMQKGLLANNIRFMHLEADNSYTLGTYEQGCFKLDGCKFVQITNPEINAMKIFNAFHNYQDDVTVYICDDGCYIYKKGRCVEKFTNEAYPAFNVNFSLERICSSLRHTYL